MKVIFLDFDGVVNTLWFYDVDKEPNYNLPGITRVNNTQAIGWLNKLCRETDAKIVITSTWRFRPDVRECLYDAGLNKNIEILDITPSFSNCHRGAEIKWWLDRHKVEYDIDNFVILDDDKDMDELKYKLVQTDTITGLDYYDYEYALKLLEGKDKKMYKDKSWFTKMRIRFKEWQYDNYLYEHQENIKDAFTEMTMCEDMRQFLLDDPWYYDQLLKRVEEHDKSKYEIEEYDAYRRYYFPINKKEKREAKADYEAAWKHHWENNDHHWQNRSKVLGFSRDREVAILENVLDWLAMSYKFGDRPFQYYEKHKNEIDLPQNDRAFLEKVIYEGIDKKYASVGGLK